MDKHRGLLYNLTDFEVRLWRLAEVMRSIQVVETLEGGQKMDAVATAHPYPELPIWDMHYSFEVGIVLSGRQRRYYEDFGKTLGAGEVYLTPAWEPHGGRATSPDTTMLIIFLVPEFLSNETVNDVSWLDLFVVPPSERPWVKREETRQQVLVIADELRREKSEQNRGWLTALRLGTLRLLLAISREWEHHDSHGGRPQARPSDLARIAPSLSLLESRTGHRVSLAEAARACSLSSSRFSFVFRHTMGLSFGEFGLRHRVTRAGQLMLTGDSPLEAIADELGFADASHLHRAFLKRYGCTPARYREMARSFHRPGTALDPEE